MVPARVTFTDETSVFLGGKKCARGFHCRRTDGDAVVYFPCIYRTVHTGDLFASGAPLIDYPGGNVVEWTKDAG